MYIDRFSLDVLYSIIFLFICKYRLGDYYSIAIWKRNYRLIVKDLFRLMGRKNTVRLFYFLEMLENSHRPDRLNDA